MLSRRGFLGAAAVLGAAAFPRVARAEFDGELCHPVDPPPALTFTMWEYDKTPFYGGPSRVLVATPKIVPPEGLPLVILLPGGHHNMQGYKTGVWGWWDEYKLGPADTALRRGSLTDKDFEHLSRPSDLERMNGALAARAYRGMVLITPWVVGRQVNPAPHGAMVTEFLRTLVARARAELPVIPTRAASGVGGMSSGGLWALYSGSACADLFSTVVGIQPFTEDLLEPLRGAIRGRSQAQRLRMLTAKDDHQRKPTEALCAALEKDGVPFELEVFRGAHSAEFAAGPGALDALLTFDRALRGEALDGSRPLPSRDGLSLPAPFADDPPNHPALRPREPTPSKGWPVAAAATALTVGAAVALRRV